LQGELKALKTLFVNSPAAL